MSSSLSIGHIFFLLYLVLAATAQTSKIFQWKFTASLSESLPTCQDLPITVQPFNPTNVTGSFGEPPYYMISFAIGGLPKTDLIGTDKAALKWTVNHPAGTSLMLSVIDSTGGAGGIPPRLYTVVTGQSTNCIEPAPANVKTDFTVTANVSDTVNTCQPWGLRIKGGIPPYNLTLAAVNSPIVTNVTMGPVDDAFTYINRADPNTKLLAAISDFTGRWAYGTPIVSTKGSANVDCIGLGSSSGNSTQIAKQAKEAAANAATAASKKKSSVIAGVVVSLLLALILGAAGWYFFVFRRRRTAVPDAEKGRPNWSVNPFSTPTSSDMVPETDERTPGQVLSITSFLTSPPHSPKSPHQSFTTNTSSIPYTEGGPVSRSASATSGPGPSPLSSRPTSDRSSENSIPSRPGFAAFPRTSTRGSAKAMEEASERERAIAEDDEYVYQHRDGGTLSVRELPPPYMNPSTPRP